MRITVSGHADDRGKDDYNERLSRRRSNAVAKYLIAQGIDKDRIILKAYGESRPAIPCMGTNCTEDDHRLNRRAEFLLAGSTDDSDMISTPDVQKTSSVPTTKVTNDQGVEMLLDEFGNKTVEGVLFKVNVGAYKKRHDLKFPELSDIGTVESTSMKGITYYFLTGFRTLGEAECARKQAIAKGIQDATISVYRNGDRINMGEFATLVH
ncbi:MAG: OmpA family protein [Chryseolinea sp.]